MTGSENAKKCIFISVWVHAVKFCPLNSHALLLTVQVNTRMELRVGVKESMAILNEVNGSLNTCSIGQTVQTGPS